MPKLTVEIRTDENGYFCKSVPFDPRGAVGSTIQLSATLLAPFATGLWGTLAIDAKSGDPSSGQRPFLLWHSETVQLGSWRLDGGENLIVVNGKTKPPRANTRIVLEIDAAP